MQISQADIRDGKMCATLINFLKAGKWDLTGKDIELYNQLLVWTKELAGAIVPHIQGKKEEAATAATATVDDPAAFSVKRVGQLPASKPAKASKKKK
jgi:hypothetical protein